VTATPAVRGHGVVLRVWRMSDVPMMVELFDTAEMDRWTPLAHPFDESVATAYVRRAQEVGGEGTLQLAITTDGEIPLGEVLLFPGEAPDECELAYAVGAAHRRHALAARAIRALLPTARERGYRTALLTIAVDNTASHAVAEAAGFGRRPGPTTRRERKGYVLDMETWARDLGPGPGS
jgi:RimJ/RimL family protein N-acetyltransferase